MKQIVEDIERAFIELAKLEKEAAVCSLAEESKYRTLCVMAVDMKKSGHKIGEIAKRLEVSRREVKRMLKHKDVASLNRRWCRV